MLLWGNQDHNVFKDVNASIHNINYGGCGFFALYLQERLDPNRFVIVAIDDNAHIMLYDKMCDQYVDSRGFHNSLYFKTIYGWWPNQIISTDTLRAWLTIKHWNTTFKRTDTTKLRELITTYNEL